ncbi:MAG: ATP synthase F1 subunit gamma [bacterium]|nr:ATP synthase F1 subunit gamma [bacterium]
MASLRQIRRRIRSVQNTQQITRAMEMVAAAKLKRAQAQLYAARPYAEKMNDLLSRLSARCADGIHPFCEQREAHNIAVVLITADKGMCGAYNANIIRFAEQYLEQYSVAQVKLILIGKRGIFYFRKRSWEILATWQDFGGKLNVSQAKEIADSLISFYLSKRVDAVYLLYSQFISGMTYRPHITKLLNIDPAEVKGQFTSPEIKTDASPSFSRSYDYIFEPNAEQLFNILLPRYITTRVYIALAESFTSEHSSRMLAMRNATDNADEMIEQLTLLRNKLRQASITKEITEIVSGAEALKG